MTNSGGQQTRPAKGRSTAPRMDQPIGEKQIDAMFQHQVDEGIKRGKPAVGWVEQKAAQFRKMLGGK